MKQIWFFFCIRSFNIDKSIEDKGFLMTFNKDDKFEHKRAWVRRRKRR
jgi:hypothetical protein